MSLFDKFVDAHGWLSDKDFIWWPFSFLKPARDEEIDLQKQLLMTACFGGGSYLMLMVVSIMNNDFDIGAQLKTLFTLLSVFFCWFMLVTRPLWNARAKRLRATKKK